ncbi:MAG: 16S rRNA (guanine(527)-N(7))-methyltransferase RsmG [Hyphomicrobiaceae bacterium]
MILGEPIIPEIVCSDAFGRIFNVSRETLSKLESYEVELKRWQRVVNLVSPATLPTIWHRHFADSAQLVELIPPTARRICDVGSGGGFPGLVLAVMLAEHRDIEVTLVESDTRKAAFLRESARRMKISVEIMSTRIESDASVKRLIGVDIITARALAPMPRLCELVAPVFECHTSGIFLKGQETAREIDEARKAWSFDVSLFQSRTDERGRIAVVKHLARHSEG